ncbi:hypothetical protein [Streptomyces sp. NPDC050704]|uniref:hypothetical protein n=1 Tax=Streptomyces sp. NPDC050704 TaxID=3157219 RepID=UPI0034138A15
MLETHRGYAIVRFLTSPVTGHFVSVAGLPSAGADIPAVRVRATAGAIVGPATAHRGRPGYIIVTGREPDTVEDQAARILRQITVTVDSASPTWPTRRMRTGTSRSPAQPTSTGSFSARAARAPSLRSRARREVARSQTAPGL